MFLHVICVTKYPLRVSGIEANMINLLCIVQHVAEIYVVGLEVALLVIRPYCVNVAPPNWLGGWGEKM